MVVLCALLHPQCFDLTVVHVLFQTTYRRSGETLRKDKMLSLPAKGLNEEELFLPSPCGSLHLSPYQPKLSSFPSRHKFSHIHHEKVYLLIFAVMILFWTSVIVCLNIAVLTS